MTSRKYATALLLATACAGLGAWPAATAFAQPVANGAPADYVPFTMEDLEQLVAPVALYPDALLAQVFVACTYPDDVLAAAQWVSAGNDPAGIESQPWDSSVQGVAHYPSTLNYMASHVDWMNNLGDAFLNQQGDVMAAVQNLRAEAVANGNLVSNDQEQVVNDGTDIEIIPTNPDVIYVPEYDPTLVYVERPYRVGERWEPLIHFGLGIRVGAWLHQDLDWRDHRVYVGDWGRDRPWWHHDGGERRYDDFRPGHFATNVARPNERSNAWQRNERKPAPRPAARAMQRGPNERPGTGYPAAGRGGAEREAPRNVAIPSNNRGSVTARESARGQQSIERAGIRPAAPRPEPARPAPREEPRPAAPAREARPAPAPAPARETHPTPAPREERAAPAPRAATPAPRPAAPAPRPAEPARATGGYQSAAAAAASSSRGAASRGKAETHR